MAPELYEDFNTKTIKVDNLKIDVIEENVKIKAMLNPTFYYVEMMFEISRVNIVEETLRINNVRSSVNKMPFYKKKPVGVSEYVYVYALPKIDQIIRAKYPNIAINKLYDTEEYYELNVCYDPVDMVVRIFADFAIDRF